MIYQVWGFILIFLVLKRTSKNIWFCLCSSREWKRNMVNQNYNNLYSKKVCFYNISYLTYIVNIMSREKITKLIKTKYIYCDALVSWGLFTWWPGALARVNKNIRLISWSKWCESAKRSKMSLCTMTFIEWFFRNFSVECARTIFTRFGL